MLAIFARFMAFVTIHQAALVFYDCARDCFPRIVPATYHPNRALT